MREQSNPMASHPQTAVFDAVSTEDAGYRVTLRPAIVRPMLADPPSLGEILDVLAVNHPGLSIECDPALRACRIADVVVRDVASLMNECAVIPLSSRQNSVI